MQCDAAVQAAAMACGCVPSVPELHARSAELVAADKLATIALLSAGVAHEVNNPAYAVLTNLALLREELGDIRKCIEGSLSPEAHAGECCSPERLWVRLGELGDLAGQCAEAMQRIVRVSQDLSELSAVPRERVAEVIEMPLVVRRVVEMLRAVIEKAAVLTIETEEGLCALSERAGVTQTVVTMLRNAVDAVKTSGRRGEISVRVCADEETAKVIVEDDGVGGAVETLAKATEPFFSTKPVGSARGMSLAIASCVALRNGGGLSLVPRAEGGTRAVLWLPRLRAGG